MLTVEPVRTNRCLKNFRSGVKEVDVYARTAFSLHVEARAESKVFCLYDDSLPELGALGYFSLSVRGLQDRQRPTIENQKLHPSAVLIYVDYFAVSRRTHSVCTNNAKA